MRDTGRDFALLFLRVALAGLFLYTGWHNLRDVTGTERTLRAMGYPAPMALSYLAAVAELGGGASVLAGLLTPLGCLALVLFLVPTTWSFHGKAALKGDAFQTISAFKNLSILGALFLLAAIGPGKLSLDHARGVRA